VSEKKTFRIADGDSGVRWIATRIGEAVAEILRERATVAPADVSPRPRREREWRSEVEGNGSSDPTLSEDNGASSWSEQEAREIVGSIRRKKRPKKSSAR
jgi:hypothetical protein